MFGVANRSIRYRLLTGSRPAPHLAQFHQVPIIREPPSTAENCQAAELHGY